MQMVEECGWNVAWRVRHKRRVLRGCLPFQRSVKMQEVVAERTLTGKYLRGLEW